MSRPLPFVLVRNNRGGANHVAEPTVDRSGRRRLACWRTYTHEPGDTTWTTLDEIRLAYRFEWVCADCRELARLKPAAFRRATGWDQPLRPAPRTGAKPATRTRTRALRNV